jgi:signal transduction histidine kinase
MSAVDLGIWTDASISNPPRIELLESGEPSFQEQQDEVTVENNLISKEKSRVQLISDGSFLQNISETGVALQDYCHELTAGELDEEPFGDRSHERDIARRIAAELKTIWTLAQEAVSTSQSSTDQKSLDLVDGQLLKLTAIGSHLDSLAFLSAKLPTFLQSRMHDLAHEVRGRYRTLIITTWASALAAVVLLLGLGLLTYSWVFRPLRHLGHGSRRIAGGDFGFRIELDTCDEMADLGQALNDMTARFQEIRDDLDHQVQLRTKEVVRSEQLASVGFLAAGVAHEINNPLASIAMCAESLEARIGSEVDAVASRYLQLIQSEAFRCKGITEKLLDFSRVGEVRRQVTALGALVHDVVDMLRHVGRFAHKTVSFVDGPDVLVLANPQEIKQVVLNLLVNALDSIDEDGEVVLRVSRDGDEAKLVLTDNGCGMNEEVLKNLFEPFFTSRPSKKGTGLGLSIVHRIVADHEGRIEVMSDGPTCGATFCVILPVISVDSQSIKGGGSSTVVERTKPDYEKGKNVDYAA